MNTLERLRPRALLAGALIALGTAALRLADRSVGHHMEYVDVSATVVEPAAVTPRDVAESNAKVGMAYDALGAMWTSYFDEIDETFAVPRLLRYRGTVRTGCGVMPQNNAVYCPTLNSIYFDEIFLAGMAKRVGSELGTDGDMAAVGVIAHEVGHAVAVQLGHSSRYTYRNEATADCLAGAFTRQSELDGYLEKGDLEEAFLGMALAGDPAPDPALDGRSERARRRAALMSHGTREQRMENFRSGLEGGAGACVPDFVQR